MKKILPFVKAFVLTFVMHFLVSLLLNYLFHDSEDISRTIFSSLLFTVTFLMAMIFLGKAKKNKESE